MELLTSNVRSSYLNRILADIERAEHFILVTAFATADGIELLEPSMRRCLGNGNQGTLILALDRQHFNAADVFRKLAEIADEFPQRLSIRIVREEASLLHAKAIFTKLSGGGATLIVGSANLTDKAFSRNHELGIWVDLLGKPDVVRAFESFAQRIGGSCYDAAHLRRLADKLAGIAPRSGSMGSTAELGPNPDPSPPAAAPVSSPSVPVEEFVGDWLNAGWTIGRGRRGLDVLVMRTPIDQLRNQGLVQPKSTKRIAAAVNAVFTAAYGIHLLPEDEDKRIRKEARRVQDTIAKVTLNLPCFGLWIPKTYWEVFQEALNVLAREGISPDDIIAAANSQREILGGEGLYHQIDAIVQDLTKHNLIIPGKENELRRELHDYFSTQLEQRSPEVLARVLGFRTQRQGLTSDVDQEVLARAFFVDLIHATFAKTFTTGSWPHKFKSYVARTLARKIAKNTVGNQMPSASLAFSLVDRATMWEDFRLPLKDVVDQFNGILGEVDDFNPPKLSEILRSGSNSGGESDGE